MMNIKQLFIATCLFGVLIFTFYLFTNSNTGPTEAELLLRDFGPLNEEVARLERLLEYEREKLRRVQAQVDEYIRINRVQFEKSHIIKGSVGGWPEAIGVLVFVCNRADAIRDHIQKLINFRKNPDLFPIIVSQDCDNEEVAQVVKSFGSQVHYVKHLSGEKANINIPSQHRHYISYYRISRHYKLGLDHVFNELGLGTVIITEDDLDIAPDFFDYFSGTRWLLDSDKSLYCVSAWNDNGKVNFIDRAANDLLYRSDFFPGLGWMMTKELWQELGSIWPLGFWDDWIRDPSIRKGRSCIRPEIPRTAMTNYGKKGASKGLFFDRYLKQITLNESPMNFSRIPLNYLLKQNYDEPFIDRIYRLPEMSVEEVISKTIHPEGLGLVVRIEYASMPEYTEIARKLHIMIDTKAGVPRTAYRGVVTCFINGVRIYIAPKDPEKWEGYDPKWEPPPISEDRD